MTGRVADWPAQLDVVVGEALRRPFAWGAQDCASFAFACAAAMLGRDPAARWRGRYTDARGAVKIISRFGGLPGLASALLGTVPIEPRQARRGDLLLACRANGPSLGVCNGAHGLFVAEQGLAKVPLSECLQAWPV